MRLMINGEPCDLPVGAGLSLQQLLQQLGYVQTRPEDAAVRGNFIVAVNQQIVSVALYATTGLNEDDCIDILGAMTGG
ncbi:MAG: MoaD/ThiS family protein [Saccharospirillaceae bacterium]|nr:MoaD/ThiS family protein [Saccharospirillaceae bacterium]MCD8531243.1 MoaD/ThiS family protein [Saccharospirillaceae bacterium]